MRGIVKAYVCASCLVTALLVANVAFAALAGWLAPEWVEEAGASLADAIETLSGSGRHGRPAIANEPERLEEPAADIAFASGPAGGLLGTPPWRTEAAAASAAALRLEAWEMLREPLFELIESASRASPGDAAIDPGAEIVIAAPRLADRLRRIARSPGERREAPTLEPRALLRLLAEESALSDETAAEVLSRMEPGDAVRVLDGLTRRAPLRAARLLERTARAARNPSTEGS